MQKQAHETRKTAGSTFADRRAAIEKAEAGKTDGGGGVADRFTMRKRASALAVEEAAERRRNEVATQQAEAQAEAAAAAAAAAAAEAEAAAEEDEATAALLAQASRPPARLAPPPSLSLH